MENIKIFAFADEVDSAFSGQIEAMKRNNLNGIEVRGVDGENISDISLEKAREIREMLDENGLVTWSIGSPIGKINITDDFTEHFEKFRHTLEVAKILGASNIRMFSFYTPKDQDPDIYEQKVFERVEMFLQEANKYNVKLCHENEKGIFGDTPERCLRLHKRFPQLAGVFDPANFVQCGVDTLKAWELLKPYTYYMHIKDAKADGFVVPSGKGEGNVAAIVKEYIAGGGRNFTIEPHLSVFDGFSSLEQDDEKVEFMFKDKATAFDTACNTFKEILGE